MDNPTNSPEQKKTPNGSVSSVGSVGSIGSVGSGSSPNRNSVENSRKSIQEAREALARHKALRASYMAQHGTSTAGTETEASASGEKEKEPSSPPVSPMKSNDTTPADSPKTETIQAVNSKPSTNDDAMIKRQAARTVQISPKPGAVSISGASPMSKAAPSPARAGRPLVPVGALALPMSAESMHREMQKEPPAMALPETAQPAVGEIDNPILEPEEVPVQPPNEDPLVMGTPRVNRPSRMSGSAVDPSDEDVKARARSGRNLESTVQPGAIPVQPPSDDPLVMGTPRLNRPSRMTTSAVDPSDEDVKARARSGRNLESTIQPGAVSASTISVSESLRRREDHAQARAERRMVRESQTEEDLQRRFEAKISQLEQHQRGSQTATGSHAVTGGTKEMDAMSKSGISRRSNNEESLRRRFDAKMAEADQQFQDNNSKQQAQRESLESSEMVMDKANAALGTPPSVVDPSRRVFADRGVASPPDVEYGNGRNPDDLAIAIMIEDDEDDVDKKDVVYAVEYDPDSKPPIYRNRRFRLYGVVCTILIVVIAVVLAVSLSSDDGPPVISPTSAPTTSREFEFRSFFASEVGDSVFVEGTPHYMASEWILNEDPRTLELSDEALLQRYLLAFLYFHSTEMETSEWRSCGRPSDSDTDSCTFMEFTRNSDDSITYTPRFNRVRWLSGEDECSWNGVECPSGAATAVGGISLFGQGLKGTLPTELAAFPFLQRVALAYNELTGSLPSEYGDMKYLLDLQVHGNTLTGTIPSEYYDIETLQLLNVGANELVGTLDTRIGLLTDLKGLHLFENNMDGTFPTEIGELSFLAFLRVNGNEFSGTIPEEFGSLDLITEFWLHENKFSGTIPSVLGNHLKNTDLRLWGNQLTGTIPDELYNLTELFRLSVRSNSLTGTLSTKIGQLTNLDILKVSRNQLTGSIPSEIQYISTLNVAWLHLNLFTGSVPSEICTLVPGEGSTEVGLSFLQADCNPTDDAPNPCLCCAGCCDRSTQVCTADDTNE